MTAPTLADLDRCIHGRHSVDPCLMCPDGWSEGNKFLEPGSRIGTHYNGFPIYAPEYAGNPNLPITESSE